MDKIRDKNGLTEEEFLEKYKEKNYPRPYLTADIVVIGLKGEQKKLLLIQRGGHPFINMWALSGGFSRQTETIEETAHRELLEETGVNSECISPIGLFSKPDRGLLRKRIFVRLILPNVKHLREMTQKTPNGLT